MGGRGPLRGDLVTEGEFCRMGSNEEIAGVNGVGGKVVDE